MATGVKNGRKKNVSTETEPKNELIVAPAIAGGLVATPQDEVSRAFGDVVKPEDRNEPAGIPICRIDHDNECFLLNGEPMEELQGYPIHWFQMRSYWAKGFSGQSTPPDCWSPDAVAPAKSVATPCGTGCYASQCPMSDWGSAPVGDGQACKVSTLLFLLNPEFGQPPVACLILPPTSIRPLLGTTRAPGYLARAKQFKNPATGRAAGFYQIVWTRLTVERGGPKFCTLVPEPLTVAKTASDARAIGEIANGLRAQMELFRGQVVDVASNTGAE